MSSKFREWLMALGREIDDAEREPAHSKCPSCKGRGTDKFHFDCSRCAGEGIVDE